MRRVGVNGVQRLAQLPNPALDGIALVDAARGALAGGGQPSRLGGRQPALHMRLHGPHAPLVLGRVEAQPTPGSRRMKQPVAALPRTQQLGAHAHAPAELADTQVVLAVIRHGEDCTRPSRHINNSLTHAGSRPRVTRATFRSSW